MGFRINTNIAAMNAHRNATNTNMGLDKSLASLSSGLRINTAADDASGMTIADSLRSQAQGLGQAINNANDGVAVVQTADGALDEYVNIINTVRTKAIQAASDGQNADSRAAIQADIDRLLQAADGIANQTQFNGQKLLDGTFTNKSFHIGAYAGETASLSVASVNIDSVGGVTSIDSDGTQNTGTANDGVGTWAALSSTQMTESSTGMGLQADSLKINGTDISPTVNALTPDRLLDAKSVADAITEATGMLASANNLLKGAAAATAGTLSAANELKINGFAIGGGSLTVSASDSDGALVNAINDQTKNTGVTATNVGGKIHLDSVDGRNISIRTTGADASTITGFTADNLTDLTAGTAIASLSAAGTVAVTFAAGEVVINGVDLQGTYGSTTAGTARNALQDALRNIDGFSDTFITAGQTTFVVNNGDDLNIAGSNVVAELGVIASDKKAINESQQGIIEIYSEGNVGIGGNESTNFGFTNGSYTATNNGTSLESINVTDRNNAEVAILISDAALLQLDSTRADLGSVQNQLESTIRNISVTQVNVASAESQIRDVDFAKESANFAKLNILAQSGSYAMSQANAVQQNVMRLLQ